MKKSWMVKAVLIGTLAILATSSLLMLLWNWLIPTVFKGPAITWWQALALFMVTKLLFGGWFHWTQERGSWKKKFEAQWSKMTPEEQARLKRSFTRQCHHWRWSEAQQDHEDSENAGSDRVRVG